MQLRRLAPLVPLAIFSLLVGCAATGPQSQQSFSNVSQTHFQPTVSVQNQHHSSLQEEADDLTANLDDETPTFGSGKSYQLPALASNILERGKSLIGTRYRFGGTSTDGFDCSGFIGYLFREQAGMTLPRSTREMINLKAPLVARNALKPGDLLFFSTQGRGRVSHAGIYLGDDRFIHSSSHRSGGVRVDSLDDTYWAKTFIEAKRALAMAPTGVTQQARN